MTRLLFVTGTDTGVGKTTVACGIVAAWRAQGLRVGVFKPIETGCESNGAGQPVAKDADRLAEAAGLNPGPACAYRLALAASPEAAAAAQRSKIDLRELDDQLTALRADCDVLVVEGAGGLLVPVLPDVSMADLALRFQAPLLIVARSSLGTINHTLLTVEAAKRRGLPVAGIVLNRLSTNVGPDESTNAEAIGRRCDAAILGTFPFVPEPATVDQLAEIATRCLDLQGLWNALGSIVDPPRARPIP